MKLYESVFIARQDLSSAQVEAMSNDYAKVVRDHGGEVQKTEFCGLKPLAYRIKKNKKGYYVLMNLKASHDAIKEVERQMKINEDVLRYISIKVEEHDDAPSCLMQKSYREERPSYRDDRRSYPSDRKDNRDAEPKADNAAEAKPETTEAQGDA